MARINYENKVVFGRLFYLNRTTLILSLIPQFFLNVALILCRNIYVCMYVCVKKLLLEVCGISFSDHKGLQGSNSTKMTSIGPKVRFTCAVFHLALVLEFFARVNCTVDEAVYYRIWMHVLAVDYYGLFFIFCCIDNLKALRGTPPHQRLFTDELAATVKS